MKASGERPEATAGLRLAVLNADRQTLNTLALDYISATDGLLDACRLLSILAIALGALNFLLLACSWRLLKVQKPI